MDARSRGVERRNDGELTGGGGGGGRGSSSGVEGMASTLHCIIVVSSSFLTSTVTRLFQ